MPGRPKKKRILEHNEEPKRKSQQIEDTNEKMSRQGREMTRGNYNEVGHNKRCCKKLKPTIATDENVRAFNLNNTCSICI